MKLVLISDTGEQVEAKCAECRHWEAEDRGRSCWPRKNDRGEPLPHRECLAAHYSDSRYGSTDDEPHQAIVFDAEGYSAELWTKPEHGCALFEAKEKP
jgi:hypothetical protein